MDLKYIQFDSICRFCCKQDFFLKPIFSEDESEEVDDFADNGFGNETVQLMIQFCTGIKISETDNLPKFLCSKCLDVLLNCNKFRRQCIQSEEHLKTISLNLESQDNNPEDAYELFTNEETNTLCPVNFSIEFYVKPEELEDINSKSDSLFPAIVPSVRPQQDKSEWIECHQNIEDKSYDTNVELSAENNQDIASNSGTENENLDSISKNENNVIKKSRKRKQTNNRYRYRQCQICGAMTQGLRLHMLTHTGEKLHKCPHCHKSFSQKGNLQRHIDIHMDNRKHKCNLCDKAFTDPKSLKSHMIKHTGEKKYECDICRKTFAYSSTLLIHKRAHRQDRRYECNICHKFFLEKYALRKHYRIHTGEKPYKCEICSKNFTSSGNLASHRKKHVKNATLKCPTCDLNFIYKSVLSNHIKKHLEGEAMNDNDNTHSNIAINL